MARPPKPIDPDRSALHWLGYELRRWRTLRRLSQKTLGSQIGFSRVYISLVETAQERPAQPFVERCDHVLETHGRLLAIHQHVTAEQAGAQPDVPALRAQASQPEPGRAEAPTTRGPGDDQPLGMRDAGKDTDLRGPRALVSTRLGPDDLTDPSINALMQAASTSGRDLVFIDDASVLILNRRDGLSDSTASLHRLWGSANRGGGLEPSAASNATEDDRFGFAATMRERWPDTRLSRPVPDYGVDWNLLLPGGQAFDGSNATVQLHPVATNQGRQTVIDVAEPGRLQQFLHMPRRGLLIGADQSGERMRFVGLDAQEARRGLSRHPAARQAISAPAAYQLDDLTYGILWAVANLDDSLTDDDSALTESRRSLRVYEDLASSAVSRDVAADLTAVSQAWLGSDFCARHILRHMDELDAVPMFWTREQRGEEACGWLLFGHKYQYLRATSERFGSTPEPLVRAFCVPETAVHAAPVFERVLLLLSMALMESLGIRVQVCAEAQYGEIAGFVLAPGRQAILANWVRSLGMWHVDTTVRRPLLREFADAAGHARAHSTIDAPTAAGRLAALADYLGLDWTWLGRRCAELGEHGLAGLARPRSRLLSLEGLDRACRYVGGLSVPAAAR